MNHLKSCLFALLALLVCAPALAETPRVVFKTSLGEIEIELFESKAPATVANFLKNVKSTHYNGTIFHRVIPGFVVQGGGMLPDMSEKKAGEPIRNEADNGLKNSRGTLSMARTSDPHSATAQFFINLKDNAMLDHTAPNDRGWGYAVFGKVVRGMEVVDKMATQPTGFAPPHANVPKTAIVLEEARLLTSK